MKNTIELKDHIIVCGAGATALHIIKELKTHKNKSAENKKNNSQFFAKNFVIIIDHLDNTLVKLINNETDTVNYLIGDATDDDILEQANIKNAYGIFPVLPSEKDNLYITITARQKNSKIKIIASTADPVNMGKKLSKAGADSVISPNFIGGLRLVSEIARPNVTEFLDKMLREDNMDIMISEIEVKAGSKLCGESLASAKLPQRTGLLVIAMTEKDKRQYIYNPPATTIINPGDIIVVLGSYQQTQKLKTLTDIKHQNSTITVR